MAYKASVVDGFNAQGFATDLFIVTYLSDISMNVTHNIPRDVTLYQRAFDHLQPKAVEWLEAPPDPELAEGAL